MLIPEDNQTDLFSVAILKIIVDVQSKMEPDPNEVAAACMQALIHAADVSLFPNEDPNATILAGLPSSTVIVKSSLYASLTISLFASLAAILDKQWINRYLGGRESSTADKSRSGWRKPDGLEK